ncbi:hypothetical protein H696_00991 [Fonticula alba]|uniref:Helicase ATP-binding domain-containing protein n=1 Tax=Fonticula alba TaxID=691883 RepID=A0A058ZIX6_FONAL|nr:hypothetical protein H696_00991 [Fonticula alba]KCV73457.1 hypothetical protein H696_00991 [Fonticula alba]|eukprot:XP_009493158.1 hypothetical protein H696_00991 [Fonticula alba]
MRFFIDDVEVIFPYSYIYPEQAQYMHMLKRTLDQRRLDPEGGDQPVHVGGNGGQPGAHALLEMPSGTGKTVTLLSFLVSYQAHYPLTTPTIVYCTRTIPEVEKTLHELRTLMAYRAEILREEGGDPLQTADALPIGAPATLGRFTAVGLTSRRNLCIHPKVVAVAAAAPAAVVDARCASRVAPWVRRRHAQWEARRRTQPPPIEGEPTRDIEEEPPSCVYYENLAALAEAGQAHPGPGVHSLEDLLTKGRERRACPYYTARGMIAHASIIVHSYAYLIDPRASAPVTSQLPSSAIVVLDEAHNLDSSCTGVLSVDITRETLDRSVEAITALETRVSECVAGPAGTFGPAGE